MSLNIQCLRSSLALLVGACAVVSTVGAPARASVLVGGTRVILREKDREASISIKNTGTSPYVVQAWIDDGEGSRKTPFVLTPPLSRLDGGTENVLRIMRVSATLPADRESVFWLNVKEIPERPQEDNVLQIAMRTRIKLFYRPGALPGTPAEARAQLRWAVAPGPQGHGAVLRIGNPSPYHVTFTALTVNGGAQQINANMVPPRGEASYPLTVVKAPQAVDVTFTTINDYGGETPVERVHVPAASEPVAAPLTLVAPPAARH